MDLHVLWLVVKWVLIALAAGFIGQFGKHLAKLILEHRRAREAGQAQLASASDPELAKLELERKRAKEQAKLEKKRAKAEVKRTKRAGDNRD